MTLSKMRNRLQTKWLRGHTTPAYKQIGITINRNRRLLTLTFVGNLLSAALETATFGVIFLALGVLQNNQLPSLPNQVASVFPWLVQMWVNDSQVIFLSLIVLIVVLQLMRSVMTYVSQVAAGDLSARIQSQMTESIFDRVISFSFACASRYKVGDLTTYVGQAGAVVSSQMSVWSSILTGGMLFASYSVVLVTISVPLSAVALLMFIALFWFQNRLLPRIQTTSMQLSDAQVEVAKNMVENIQALRLVHTFGREKQTIERVKFLQSQVLGFLRSQVRLIAITRPMNSALTILVIASLLVAGSLFLRREYSGILPALATFILSLNRLSAQVQGLTVDLNDLARNSGGMTRLDTILQVQDKEFSRQGGEVFEGLNSCVSFEQVSLHYDGTTEPALSNLSFKLQKNSVTALVGQSGAGKSSIADLLIGLYAPTSGKILVDGLDLQTYSWESWRSRLGVVSQDTFIFNQSILENIRYGIPEATDTEVWEAARLAQADKFIQVMPQGYDTVVGERGYRLSGGQRQRIALARAILKKPEILILDEATSALDSQSERLVQEALNQFEYDRTVLVIAHRLSTIIHADQIVVMEQGKVVEQGNHGELMALEGKYARYWSLQSFQLEKTGERNPYG